jgi:hypothetical protein
MIIIIVNVIFLPFDFVPIPVDSLGAGGFRLRIPAEERDFSFLQNLPDRL